MAQVGAEALLWVLGLFPSVKWGDAGLWGGDGRFAVSVFPSAAQVSMPAGTEGAGFCPALGTCRDDEGGPSHLPSSPSNLGGAHPCSSSPCFSVLSSQP